MLKNQNSLLHVPFGPSIAAHVDMAHLGVLVHMPHHRVSDVAKRGVDVNIGVSSVESTEPHLNSPSGAAVTQPQTKELIQELLYGGILCYGY